MITFTLGLLLGLITVFQEQVKNTFVAISLTIFLSFIVGVEVNVISDKVISHYEN